MTTPAQAPRILLLATGGTIAGRAAAPLDDRYEAGADGIAGLRAAAKALGTGALLTVVEVASVGSQDIDIPVWRRLADSIRDAFAADSCDGVVVAHGTDTAEETAFLLDLVLPAGRPVIVTGAMRPPQAIGADGPRNLASAIRVAGDPSAAARGVLVVLGDEIHAARLVHKAQTGGADAFSSSPSGPLGSVSPAGPRFFAPGVSAAREPLPWPASDAWPPVAILYCHAAMDRKIVEAIIAADPAGIVLAGVGGGNAPGWILDRLTEAAARGLVVIRSTRIDGGIVTSAGEVDDTTRGFIAGGMLSPQKCRLQLQLLLAAGMRDVAALRETFA